MLKSEYEQLININNEEPDNVLDDSMTPTMERLRHKKKLISDTTDIFKVLAQNQNNKIYPKGLYKTLAKSVKKDIRKGLKIINKNNPVYIEMPKLEKVGNGQVKQIANNNDDENIKVNLPMVNIPTNNNIQACQ